MIFNMLDAHHLNLLPSTFSPTSIDLFSLARKKNPSIYSEHFIRAVLRFDDDCIAYDS